MQVPQRTAMVLPRLALPRPLALPLAAERRAMLFVESQSREKPLLPDSVPHPAGGLSDVASPTMQTPPAGAPQRSPLSPAVFSLKRFGVGTPSPLARHAVA